MYPTHGEQQKKEIETIRKRTIELELSDTDVKRIAEKAGAHGMTVGKLLESFIATLICGTYSNGSWTTATLPDSGLSVAGSGSSRK